MQLHALNYMTMTHPLHDITWYGTFDSRRLHNHYIESTLAQSQMKMLRRTPDDPIA